MSKVVVTEKYETEEMLQKYIDAISLRKDIISAEEVNTIENFCNWLFRNEYQIISEMEE